MRVGLLTADLRHSHGWGHYCLSMIDALRASGVEVTVVAATNSPTDFDFPVQAILPTVSPAEPNQLVKLWRVASTVRTTFANCDLIHCMVEPYAPLAWWLRHHNGYIITGHGSYVQAGIHRNALVMAVHHMSFEQAAVIACVSHYTARVAEVYLPGVQTTVINNGIDPQRFANLPTLPESVTRPTIISAGGIKKRKGTPELVRAIGVVRESIPDVQCVIIGNMDVEPESTKHVRQMIGELDLHNHVQLLGFVDDSTLLGWYNAADVMVLPSMNDGWKFEGFGLVHLEASAAGLPVIGTRDCGAEDAIDDGVTGLLVSQSMIDDELPAAILRLLENPSLARQMGTAGQQKAWQYTWEHAAVQLIEHYKTIIYGSPPSGP